MIQNLAIALFFLLFFIPGAIFADAPNWQGKMKSFADTMGELLPELVSNQGDPKVIEKSAKTLSELSHDLKEGQKGETLMPPLDNDPTVKFLAGQFSDQARRAHAAIKQGQMDYGKKLLQSVTSYCIACHTRHDRGSEFSFLPLNAKTKSLGKEDKAALYVATRQFDKGLAEYLELVSDQELIKKRPFDWDRQLRQALTIAIRVKKDPNATSKAVATALKSPFLPSFERAKLSKWQAAIEAWKTEPKIKSNTEAGFAAEMRRLFHQANSAKFYPVDHSAEIQFLRVSAAAHDVLRVAHDSKLVAEALMTAGVAYEALANPTWPMHEFFYEACIRQLPHSSLAHKCYSRFEQSVYFGYTGSSGTHIPDDVQKILNRLRILAAPLKTSGPKNES